MEMEELKNIWSTLDDRLKQSETLNDRLIKEMLHTKVNKAINRLTNFEIFGTILTILVVPFLFYVLTQEVMSTPQITIIYGCIIYASLGIFTQLWKVYMLMKVDFSKPASNNIKWVHSFNIQIRREKIATVIVLPILLISILFSISFPKVEIWRWALLIGVSIISILSVIWQYKKVYDNNINSILKSLDELKELDES